MPLMPESPINSSLFNRFDAPVSDLSLPTKFTFPFFYQPHQIAILACDQLQQWLVNDGHQLQNFDLDGKMFGVLVVRHPNGELGYLVAYSGKTLSPETLGVNFCHSVNEKDSIDTYVNSEQTSINGINSTLDLLTDNPQLNQLSQTIDETTQSFKLAIIKQQQAMVVTRQSRKQQRQQGLDELSAAEFELLEHQLASQSIHEKNTLRDLKTHWQTLLDTLVCELSALTNEISTLKNERKERSNALQQVLFSQYQFLNAHGQSQDLNQLFINTPQKVPPSGAGDCAAPKLMQSAYKLGLEPIALAEFWWGVAPKSQVRQHQQFYAACIGKCQPILNYMLQGLTVDDNPLLENTASDKTLAIVHQEETFLVINKPAGLLSVPGKSINDSVKTRIQAMFPDAKGGIIVHRLDMATSGLMLIALTERANKNLQHQFIKRIVEKCYVAIVDGLVEQDSGVIELPLCGDFDDRPRQMVCHTTGKPSYTTWQVTKRDDHKTWLTLWPKTGRTHQLRVHCAHHQGLNYAMIGDGLYGKPAERLMLHAKKISFNHPITKQPIVFDSQAPF
jgi:tRNA pseudouridine32 synthase/23S rRNA pseudouridine746 synthase